MNKADVTQFFKTARSAVVKHSPEILTGVGIAGMITTTVLAVQATPKALRLIEEKKKEDHVDKLTPLDTVKVAWKPYIPAAATCVLSTTCLIGASSVNSRRNAALAAAYNLSKTALADYKEKVIETIGEKKEEAIRDKVAKKKVEENTVANSSIIITDDGNTLCLETVSMRYFRSDIDKIRKVVNELNRRMLSEMYISLSEFYDELDLPHTANSDELGWNIDVGLIEVSFSAQLAEKDRPCVVIDFLYTPEYNYQRLY